MRVTRLAALLATTVAALSGCASNPPTRQPDSPETPGATQIAAAPATATIDPMLSIAR